MQILKNYLFYYSKVKITPIKFFLPVAERYIPQGICYSKAGKYQKEDKNKKSFTPKAENTQSLIIVLPAYNNTILNIPQTKIKFSIGKFFKGYYKDENRNVFNKESQTIELSAKFNLKSKLFISNFLKENNLQTVIIKDIKNQKIYQIEVEKPKLKKGKIRPIC